MILLQQGTSGYWNMGPFVASTDAITQSTGLTIAQANVLVSKNGSTYSAKSSTQSATYNSHGDYRVPYSTGDTDTLGRLRVSIATTGELPVWQEFMVVPTNVYQGLILGTDLLEVDAKAVSNSTATADNLETITSTGGVSISTGSRATLVDEIWDEVITGAAHNVNASAAKFLREAGSAVIRAGTAQAGASNSIQLDTGASATNEIYDDNLVVITAGTGVGQSRRIVEYNGTSKVAIVDRTWVTNPASDSEFEIFADASDATAQHGIAAGGSSNSITLNSNASTVSDLYNGELCFIATSAGTGQTRLITDYDGGTKVASVSPDWAVSPTTNSVYKILPVGRAIVDSISTTEYTNIADAVLRRNSSDSEASSIGDTLDFRSLYGAVAKLTNKISASTSTLTIYKTDDATSLGTQAITSSSSANPITALDTA